MPQPYPPGPRDWSFGLGQVRQINADALAYYQRLQRTYGDIVYTRLGPYRDYVFFHPDQIREFLVTKAKSFRKMPLIRKILSRLDGDGLVISEGDHWLRQRRLVQPAFHARRFGRYAEVMVSRTLALVERWKQQIAAAGALEVEITKEMTDLTLAIIARTMFDADLSTETAAVGQAVSYLSHTFVSEMQSPFHLPDWLPLPHKIRKRRAIALLDATVRRFIADRRASGQDRGDLLSMLLLAVDEEGDGKSMTDEQARDEVMTLFMAGHDTTAAGLTWLWYNLARFPDIAERAAREVAEVLAGKPPTTEDVPRLRYLDMVLKETLRLFPPAIGVFTRQAIADVEIGGYPLARGSLVHAFSFVTQRDSRWFPDPERFDPERWTSERAEKLPQFAYFPFGGGPRICIGQGFATMEMILVAATMLQHLRPSLAAGQGEPVLLAHLSLRPKGGLRMCFRAAL